MNPNESKTKQIPRRTRHYRSAQTRFMQHLPTKPYCSNALDYGVKIRSRKTALRFQYIQLNNRLRFYLAFDVDRPGAAFEYEDARLPAPTITVVNPDNAHAHLLYELEDPVAFKDRNGKGKARIGPIRFYQAMLRAMTQALDADHNYTHFMVKNPRHKRWYTIFNDFAVYSLEELADYVDPIWKKDNTSRMGSNDGFAYDPEEIVYKGMRNDYLFDAGRYFCYVSQCLTLEIPN